MCPSCHSAVRHRLFLAALVSIDQLSFERLIRNKRILHFAPEEVISSNLHSLAAYYVTADLLGNNAALKIDMSNMHGVENASFDAVIAFDVLEHVPDYRRALREVHRVLRPTGWGILAVPQKDGLLVTHEDSSILTPEERTRHFGQGDHLRIFGDNFPRILEEEGFTVMIVDESCFPQDVVARHVLFPRLTSRHPLATNHRRVFFCQKT